MPVTPEDWLKHSRNDLNMAKTGKGRSDILIMRWRSLWSCRGNSLNPPFIKGEIKNKIPYNPE